MNYIKEILVNLVRSTLMTKFADLDQAEKRRISFEKNRKAKLIRVPKFSEIPYPTIMEPNLVIEYYSR